MKSIILLVLLALCHIALAKPQNWASSLEESNFGCSEHGAKRVFVVSGDANDSDDDDNSADASEPHFKLLRQPGNENGNDDDDDDDDSNEPDFKLFRKPGNHNDNDNDDDDDDDDSYEPRLKLFRKPADDDSKSDDDDDDENKTLEESHHSHEHSHHSHEHSHHSHEHSHHSHEHDKIDCDCNKNKSKPKITYGPEQIVKGKPETYIHHQPKIIVRQPPTHVRIEHPPTIIHPSTIVFRRNGKTIRRPVIYQHLPQDVRVRPVYVKVVKPIEKKVIVDSKHDVPSCISKSHHNDDKVEYEKSYGGRTYTETFDEHEHERESYHAHLNVKETEPYQL